MLLINNNKFLLIVKHQEYEGKIEGDEGYDFNCYANFPNYWSNRAIFYDLNINIKRFFIKYLGYYCPHGNFPYCKTKEDVIKILKKIDEIYDVKDNVLKRIPLCTFQEL